MTGTSGSGFTELLDGLGYVTGSDRPLAGALPSFDPITCETVADPKPSSTKSD